VGEGVGELKIDFGPGYRVYFGRVGATIVVLLCGGDKKTQKKDIVKAKEQWQDFKERYHGKED
jgi:putative addiction module killer protein